MAFQCTAVGSEGFKECQHHLCIPVTTSRGQIAPPSLYRSLREDLAPCHNLWHFKQTHSCKWTEELQGLETSDHCQQLSHKSWSSLVYIPCNRHAVCCHLRCMGEVGMGGEGGWTYTVSPKIEGWYGCISSSGVVRDDLATLVVFKTKFGEVWILLRYYGFVSIRNAENCLAGKFLSML